MVPVGNAETETILEDGKRHPLVEKEAEPGHDRPFGQTFQMR
jgi:hypothetical protein